MNEHIGSSLNEFLEEEGLLTHTEEVAHKRIVENYRALGRPFNGKTFLIRKTAQEVEEILAAFGCVCVAPEVMAKPPQSGQCLCALFIFPPHLSIFNVYARISAPLIISTPINSH